ncbi:macro domain-containing protein [Enterococcus avium]|uniref:Macro domain-containing protein n=1 Tax=Enterococcus avium TaxID=33945 RepID=A0ABD5FFA2_ENTAV|nr:macro domain-containing protein [Enterococcus avium]MDT2396904.1 macro domain-containing protein [Enterococcus avium]MDT2435907.1 macro domain-containing protein [Enterococcus avium]MDT2447133.1 macro domain-containing protein [Enterococcus avium]MDT2465876.1 macro domain-containing protein [Enterococcus avium]MDT2483032.1 macro domain-containing protein [Enterococcus avium]
MIEVKLGDISRLANRVDAIVNAANIALIPGGGVDGALNQAAGLKLKQAMAKIGGTPTGTAVITPAFDLPAKYVIHAVGPRYIDGQHDEETLLYSAYEAVFQLARENDIQTLAVPVLSAGIYQYPKEAAARSLYNVANRVENQRIATQVIVFDDVWLEIFKKIKRGSKDESD